MRIKLRKNQSTLPRSLELPHDLQELQLYSDSIEAVPYTLSKLDKLKKLELFLPRCKELPDWLFWGLPELELLRLKGGLITELPLKDHGQHSKLKILSLNQNKLTHLPDQMKQLSSLEVLELSGNQLSSLGEGLEVLKRLKRLNLESNQLTKLPEGLYQLPDLKHLALDGNPLTEQERQKLFDHFKIWF